MQEAVKWLRKITGALFCGCFGGCAVLAVLAIGSVALLIGAAANVIKTGADVSETEVYKKVQPLWDSYREDTLKEMEKRKQEIILENTAYLPPEETGGEGTVVCEVTVDVIYNDVSMAYFFAYKTAVSDEAKTGKWKSPKKEEVYDFLEKLSQIETEQEGTRYRIYNRVLSAEEVEQTFFPEDDSKRKFYQTSLNNYLPFFNSVTGGGETAGDISYVPNGMNIPLYLQYKEPWGSMAYGSSTISKSGCSPTCIAMVVSYLKNTVITPADVVSFTGGRYYIPGVGSSWNIFADAAAHYEISCTNLGRNMEAVMNALSGGKPVIASMRPGTFSNAGHFIVLRGITEDGYLLVNDPADTASKNHADRKFAPALIGTEAKNFWSFGK